MTDRSRHVAFVCPRFAEGPTVGGAETLLKNLARRIALSGRKVTFLTTCARNHFTWENELPAGSRTIDDIDVHFFPVDPERNVTEFLNIQSLISANCRVSVADELIWLQNSVNSGSLCDYLKENGNTYDRIVMGPYLFGLIYFASQIYPEKTLLVPCLHDESFAYLKSIGNMFNNVRGCMFNSVPEKELASRLYVMEKSSVSSVVGMGMDDFATTPGIFKSAHDIRSQYLIYSGRREPLKGTPLLIDYLNAFRSRTNRDVKLVLTGTGHAEIPEELTNSIIDLGFLSEKDKHAAMADAVAFCHPSVNESFGIVLMESFLAGTPVLVHSKSAVLKYHCKQSNAGFWFNSYPEFEEELQLLLNNQKLRNAMGNAGRQYVLKEYSWHHIDEKLFVALEK